MLLSKALKQLRSIILITLQCCALLGVIIPSFSLAAEKHLYKRDVDDIFEDKQVQTLAKAAAKGDLEKIEQLVKDGVAVDSQGYMGVTPLWWAAQRQNIKGFRKLLELGADPNHQWRESGNSVMDHVVRMKSPEYLRAALEHGGNPNLLRGGVEMGGTDTPLFSAMFESPTNDNSETIQVLIEAGADVNFVRIGGATPLMAASALGLWDVMLMMLEHGADYTVKSPAGINPALDYLQSSIERERNLPKGKNQQRQQVIDFLTERGVNLSDYSRSVYYPKMGIQ